MTTYAWLTTEQLEKKVEELRIAAHEAPKAIGNGSTAWTNRARDWQIASDALELRRKANKVLGEAL